MTLAIHARGHAPVVASTLDASSIIQGMFFSVVESCQNDTKGNRSGDIPRTPRVQVVLYIIIICNI